MTKAQAFNKVSDDINKAKDNMAKAAADLAEYGFDRDAEQLMRMVYRLEAFQNKCR